MILGDFLGFAIDLTVVFNLTRSGGFFFGPRPYRCSMKRRRLADASQIPLVDAMPKLEALGAAGFAVSVLGVFDRRTLK